MLPPGPRQTLHPSLSGPAPSPQMFPVPSAPIQLLPHQALPGLTNVLMGLYSMMLTVPIAEILIVYLHAHISVVVIVDAILTILLIMSGRLGRFFETPMAKPWMVLLVLYGIAAVLGVYKGESVPFIFEYGIRFHVLPLYFCALALTPDQVRKSLRWMGWGMLLLVFLCFKFGTSEDGRFLLPDTSLSNPNDLAFAFLFGMSCLMLNKSKLARAMAVGVCGVVLYFILKTASRASLITLIAMVIFLFIFASRRMKILLVIAVPVTAALLIALTPSFAIKRLSLITPNEAAAGNDSQLRNAIDSEEARSELQQRAIKLALHNPLFGVGPLEFLNGVELMVRQSTGQKSGWQGAHNTYLQVAAEAGIPAMILYLVCLYYCAKLNIQTFLSCRRNPTVSEAGTQSLVLILMTIAFAVCVAFSNNAYDPRVDMLVALSAANFLAVRDELRRQNAGLPPAATARAMPASAFIPKRQNLRPPRPAVARY